MGYVLGMGLWDQAQNTLDMMNASIQSLQLFDRLTRFEYDRPGHEVMRTVLGLIRCVVVTMIEGYQGKLRGKQILNALAVVNVELDAGKQPGPEMFEKFKGALL